MKRNFTGTGLGLSITKKLVEILGGEIWVESEKGKGSVFYFTLPLSGQTVEEVENQKEARTKEHKGLTMLVAEDEEINFLYLEAILCKEGVHIIRATNGAEAVEEFKTNEEIDLVLMDIKMPVMDGYEALDLIKGINPDVPVVALTAYALAEEKEKGLERGFDDYLSKPLKMEVLNRVLRKLKEQYKAILSDE